MTLKCALNVDGDLCTVNAKHTHRINFGSDYADIPLCPEHYESLTGSPEELELGIDNMDAVAMSEIQTSDVEISTDVEVDAEIEIASEVTVTTDDIPQDAADAINDDSEE